MPGLMDLLGGLGGADPSADPTADQGGGLMDALGGLSESDARSLSLVNALHQTQQAGLQRTATPIGAIANALLPLVMAPIAARQAQMQSMKGALPIMLELMKLKANAEDRPLELRKKTAETANLESQVTQRTKAQELMDKLLGGSGGIAGTEGMKPKISVGPNGPTISYGSDVLSPEALQQRKDIQAAGVATSTAAEEQKQKNLTIWKEGRPKNLSPAAEKTVDAGNTLLGLLNDAEDAVASIPKDVNSTTLAREAGKYQWRAEHPELANIGKGYSFGLLSADTDPRLDKYLSWVGQVDSALASFNLQGMRGGYKTLQYLRAHFPGYADTDPQTILGKAKALRGDRSVISRTITEQLNGLRRAAQTADATPGGEAAQGWVGRPVFDKGGAEKRLWVNEQSGESLLLDPGQAPPLE